MSTATRPDCSVADCDAGLWCLDVDLVGTHVLKIRVRVSEVGVGD